MTVRLKIKSYLRDMLPLLFAREGGRRDEFLSFINMGSVRRLTKYEYAATEELENLK
jgi:hypothetical protein